MTALPVDLPQPQRAITKIGYFTVSGQQRTSEPDPRPRDSGRTLNDTIARNQRDPLCDAIIRNPFNFYLYSNIRDTVSRLATALKRRLSSQTLDPGRPSQASGDSSFRRAAKTSHKSRDSLLQLSRWHDQLRRKS